MESRHSVVYDISMVYNASTVIQASHITTDPNAVSNENLLVVDTNIVSAKLVAVFSLVAVGVLCTALGAMGVCTNSINLAVYFRQGFTDGTSVTLTALAFSDIFISLLTTCLGLCFMFDYLYLGQGRINWLHIMELAFAWPRSMASDISVGITVFISAERALCVTWPLRIANIVTRNRSIVIVITIFICIFGCYIPAYLTAGISWQPVPTDWGGDSLSASKVVLRLQMWRTPGRQLVEEGTMVYNTIWRFMCYGLVVFFSIIMVSGLRAASRFRNKSAGKSNMAEIEEDSNNKIKSSNQGGLTNRDRRAVRVVSSIATMFIICMFPVIVAMMSRFIEPEIITGGEQENLLWLIFSIVYLSEAICASCNMFVYLGSSSRYKENFYAMFGCSNDDSQNVTSTN